MGRPSPGAARSCAVAAETPLAAGEIVDCPLQLGFAEIGPQAFGEVELGIGELPQQEVADAALAAGADAQVGLGQFAQLGEGVDEVDIDGFGVEAAVADLLGDQAHGVGNVPAAAIIRRHGHPGAGVVPCQFLDFGHAALDMPRERPAVADETQAHVGLVELVHLVALQHRQEQRHQPLDLLGGTHPVFAAEGEQRQAGNLAAHAGEGDFPGGFGAMAVARLHRQSPALRPAVVAVHDDGDMLGQVFGLAGCHFC